MAYSRVERHVWHDERFRQFSPTTRLVWLYLLTCPHLNRLGCFVLPPMYAAEDTQLSPEAVLAALAELQEAGRVEYDPQTRLLILHRFLKHNAMDGPNVVKAAVKELDALPFHEGIFVALAHAVERWGQPRTEKGEPHYDLLTMRLQERFSEGYGEPFPEGYGESKPKPKPIPNQYQATAKPSRALAIAGRQAGGGVEAEQRNTSAAAGAADSARSDGEWLADDAAWEIPERAAEYAGTGVVPASERPAMLARIRARPADELARYGIRGSIAHAAIEWGKSRTRSGGTGAAVRELGIELPPHINPEVARLITGWAAAHEAEASALLDEIKTAAPTAGEAVWAGRFVAEAKKRAQAEGVAA